MSPGGLRFSVIIPAYNEAAYLPRLLESIEAARGRYRGGRDGVEVIVGDNASTDATAAIAAAYGCRVAHVEKRAIAAARNGGAAIARGSILAFVDADTRVHAETFNEIDRLLGGGDVIGGATGAWPERWSAGLAVTHGLLWLICVIGRADIGVVFCGRADFEAIGGYNEDRLFAEDVQLLLDLRSRGASKGQHLVRGTRAKAVISTRKFDKYGDWHYFTFSLRVLWHMIRHPLEPNVWAARYWYEDR